MVTKKQSEWYAGLSPYELEVEYHNLKEMGCSREEIAKVAANSEYAGVRRFVIEDRDASPDILDKIFEKEMEEKNFENIRLLLENRNFKVNEGIRKRLAKSEYFAMRQMIAEYYRDNSSAFLNQMLRDEIEGEENERVERAILNNINFKMDDDSRKLLVKSKNYYSRIKVAEDEESSSDLLKQMLKAEIEGEDDEEVVEAILDNYNFKMDDDSRKVLAKSKNPDNRKMVADDDESSSDFLKQMLKAEIEGEEDEEVVEAILKNSNFKIDDDSRKVLAKSKDWTNRKMVAEDEGSTLDLLKQMLKAEIEGEEDEEVVNAILKNSKFEMDDEIREKLSKADESKYRKIAARDKGATLEFLEKMYLEEDDETVISVIEHKIKKKRFIQKQQILKTLKESKEPNDFVQECLYQILEILLL